MSKIWLFSYSTSVHRLMKKTFTLAYAKPNESPWDFGPWEFDTQDYVPELDEDQLELLHKATLDSYGSEKAKTKKAVNNAVARDNDEHRGEDSNPELVAEQRQEGRATSREQQDEDEEEGEEDPDEILDDNSKLAQSIPQSVRAQAYADAARKNATTTFVDKKGAKRKMVPRFVKKYKVMVFPVGFYFEHMNADECHVLRNPRATWSRLFRIFIKMSHKYRKDEKTSSILLVSATPAINDISNYRGLSNLF